MPVYNQHYANLLLPFRRKNAGASAASVFTFFGIISFNGSVHGTAALTLPTVDSLRFLRTSAATPHLQVHGFFFSCFFLPEKSSGKQRLKAFEAVSRCGVLVNAANPLTECTTFLFSLKYQNGRRLNKNAFECTWESQEQVCIKPTYIPQGERPRLWRGGYITPHYVKRICF